MLIRLFFVIITAATLFTLDVTSLPAAESASRNAVPDFTRRDRKDWGACGTADVDTPVEVITLVLAAQRSRPKGRAERQVGKVGCATAR